MWAQRPTLIFLTVCLEDCKDPEIKVESDKLHFKGVGGSDKKLHEITINFFKEIDPEVSFVPKLIFSANVPYIIRSKLLKDHVIIGN